MQEHSLNCGELPFQPNLGSSGDCFDVLIHVLNGSHERKQRVCFVIPIPSPYQSYQFSLILVPVGKNKRA